MKTLADVSAVTTMEAMFDYSASFNQDISAWMSRMSRHERRFGWDSFNQP